MNESEIQEIEIDELVNAIFKRYGYDFKDYARASLTRRINSVVAKVGVEHISDLIPRILRDETVFEIFLRELSVTVTEMFRDPNFYAILRDEVFPFLQPYPLIKIWHAGCATGEEVYSMAILLKEEGLYSRTRIYATDYNNESLVESERGIYPVSKMSKFTANYNKTNPKASFSDYYHSKFEVAKMSESLKENITFANHNLVTDGAFGEMNLIVCRNVMIYFNQHLQNRVLRLFHESISPRGILCLGPKESLKFSSVADKFMAVSGKNRIYRLKGSSRKSDTPAMKAGHNV
ncbi:protein-glutamate O-methyltransferase CheR [bacterium AH-315-P07]|nr:protein-glutamate O-methyltransferase CheR [bacterium AH-315-P07]